MVPVSLAACHGSSGSSSFLPPGTTDLGFAADSLSVESGILAAREFEDGRDLTGDGDGNDSVLHVVDLDTGRSTLVKNVQSFSNGGGFVACVVWEGGEDRDLNGDGDVADAVLHVVDGKRGIVRNLGLAVGFETDPVQAGARIAFGMRESDQGGLDINGDGNSFGEIVHVHDALRGTTTSLDIPIRFGSQESIELRGSRIVALGYEDQTVDLNGDGDASGDEVVFVHDLDTGTTENLGLAVRLVFAFDGHVLATRVDELDQAQDLNGDGDENDRLLELVALDSGTRHLLDKDAVFVRADDGLAFVELDEGAGVLLYDSLTDTFIELGDVPIREGPRLADRRAAFLVEEANAGDVNRDGDTNDGVLFLFDARTLAMTNTGVAVLGLFDAVTPRSFELDDRRAAYLYSAFNDNFVGTWPDAVARVRDVATGAEQEIAPADDMALAGGRVVLQVPEDRLGRDLNGDQDENDAILQVYDPRSRATLDTGLPISHGLLSDLEFRPVFALEGHYLVISVPEFVRGRDETGDGDVADSIVHAVRLP